MQMSQSLLNTSLKFSLKDMTVPSEQNSAVFCSLSRAEIRTRKLGIDRLALTNSFIGLKPLSGKRLHLPCGQVISSKGTVTYNALCSSMLRSAKASAWNALKLFLPLLTSKFSDFFLLTWPLDNIYKCSQLWQGASNNWTATYGNKAVADI